MTDPIRIIREPSVYLFARQQIDEAELSRFLVDNGSPNWTTDTEVAAERLVEIGGRLCYSSYAKPRPGGNKAYIDHIRECGHGSVMEAAVFTLLFTGVSRSLCFHPDTEVLTRQGWKSVADVAKGDILLTKNPATGDCRWSPALSSKTFWYDGELHHVQTSQGTLPSVTADHLLWVGRYDLRRARGMTNRQIMDRFAEKVPAKDIQGLRYVVDHEIRMEGVLDPEEITVGNHTYNAELFFEWLGWVLTDGGISKTRNQCYIVQSKPKTSARISVLMQELFQKRVRTDTCNGLHKWFVFDADLKQFLVVNFGRLKRDRHLSWLFGYSRRLLSQFLSAAIAADGSTHAKNGLVIYCGYPVMAQDFQTIAAMTGQSSYVRAVNRVGESHFIKGGRTAAAWNRPEHVVSLHRKSASVITREQQHVRRYTGFVHCPETSDGLVYVRDHGMGVWSGNSHELIRHRTLSPSELSQRYVDCEDVAFVVPPAMAQEVDAADQLFRRSWAMPHFDLEEVACLLNRGEDDDPLSIEEEFGLHWFRSIATAREAYSDLTDYLADTAPAELTGTERRKWARQAARSVLPNCAETRIMMTGNVRSWRNVIEQRASRHSDVEIRCLFGVVYDVLLREAPTLFSDYTTTPLPDGSREITTATRKV